MQTIIADDGTFFYNIVGIAEGTSYSIIYRDELGRDFQSEIEMLFANFEKSLSVYDRSSIISRINRNEDVEVDDLFEMVFNRAKTISLLTNGAFDVSAGPLFSVWGFGVEQRSNPDEEKIKKIRALIGMDKVRIENKRIVKDSPDLVLNMNAIAKGYSADIVADFLIRHNCSAYLVEVGGEIRAEGVNPHREGWRIGIDRPSDSNLVPGQDLQVILQISGKGVATSGNYRQFYFENGRKISHTIDPVSGYPVTHNLLSVTVIADDAISADAFATAFMVAGIEQAVEWMNDEQFPDVEALFICDEGGGYKVYYTEGVENYLVEVYD